MKRNKFSLSHYKLLSCDMGELVPCGLVEVLPGDTLQQATSALVRLSPLLAPVMHPVHARIHHWYVPHRLVWEDFEDFITGGPDGMDASTFPTINFTDPNPAVGTLADYLGVPPGYSGSNFSVSALPFRGYAMIWNEWYRDQDLQTALTIDLTSGADTTTSTALQSCAWEKDYFTSSRPWEQKGPTVTLPLGTTAPVLGIGLTGSPANLGSTAVRESSPLPNRSYAAATGAAVGGVAVESDYSGGAAAAKPLVYADLSQATAVTINTLREALALQRFEEARARYGSRYVEYLRYLGVRSSDARLQRPEYLGGGRQTIQFSEVLQTSPGTWDSVDDPVGQLRGHGIGALRSNRYRRFFEEHGYVFTFISIRPKTMYGQSMARTWNRRVKEDFWQRELQHIGQQEIQQQEVAVMGGPGPTSTFGYQDRYDEYRRTESSIAGEFRTTLDHWHFARIFGSAPALNADFVKCVPTERTFAVPSTDVLYVMASHSIQARRQVAARGTSFTF